MNIIFSNFLLASTNEYFTTITWDWMIIIVLILLFFVLLLSIIRDNKNRKKALEVFFEQEKCKKNGEYSYLKEINNERIDAVNQLHNSLIDSDNRDDKDINSEIKKNYKNIFDNNREEKIFLNIATNSTTHKNREFKTKELIDEIKKSGTLEYDADSLPQKIVADKDIVSDILFLLKKLLQKEHGLSTPQFSLNLLANNSIKIDIPNKLTINPTQTKVLENGIKPIYNSADKQYYGVYLYLIKKLLNKINGLLTINSQNSSYKISLTFPVDIIYNKHKSEEAFKLNRKLEKPKKALLIANTETSHELSNILTRFNFTTEAITFKELNKEIPNFMEYDTVFMDSELFEPILTEYLESIKPLSRFQLIALINSDNPIYPINVVDFAIEKPITQKRVAEIIATLYSSEMVSIDKENSDTKKAEEAKTPEVTIKNVLIANDDRVNLHILEYAIKSYGLSVTAVTDGLKVLKELENKHYDLIILDSMMPHLDGYQTVTKIRQDSRFNATPVVIHTSFSLNKSSMESIFKLGFDSYLPNPFSKSELKALLNRYLSTHTNTINKAVLPQLSQKETIKSFKEFLAIYSDSDRILEKYIKEKRNHQALSLIDDLKKIGSKIGGKELNSLLDSIKAPLEKNSEVDENLIYDLSATLKKLKLEIAEKLEKN